MTGLPPQTFERIGGGSGPSASLRPSGIADPQPWFGAVVAGMSSADPRRGLLTEWQAMNMIAFYTAVKLVAGTIAALPCKVYRRRPDGGADEAPDHPVNALFQREYNPNTAALTGREAECGHLLGWGNSYTQIVRNRSLDVVRLQPLGPDLCKPDEEDGRLIYDIRDWTSGEWIATLERDEVLHTPYFSFDSLAGLPPVRLARNSLSAAAAQERSAERYIRGGFRSPGVIKLPEGKRFRTETEATQFRNRFRAIHNSADGDTEVVILEDGAEWADIGTDPATAQLLESRRFSRGEIAALYHIPLHMLGEQEKQTSWGSGIEEQQIGFVTYCLLPILRRFEQERTRKLFLPGRRQDEGLYVEHILAGLLRGDSKRQSEVIRTYLEIGVLSVNEARRLMGHNPLPHGNVTYFPLNYGRVDAATGQLLETPAPAAARPAADPAAQARKAAAVRKGLLAAVGRCLRKEAAEAREASAKPAGFLPWLDRFYDKHAVMVAEACDPLWEVWAADRGRGAEPYSGRHVERSKADLLAAAECPPAELAARVGKCVERWLAERPAVVVAELYEGVAGEL